MQVDEPIRRCILSGEREERDRLIRLALSPEGIVLPDVAARAPGRGAWLSPDRTALESAIAKHKFKGALSRAFKSGDIGWPEDLAERIALALQRPEEHTSALQSLMRITYAAFCLKKKNAATDSGRQHLAARNEHDDTAEVVTTSTSKGI